MADEGGSGRPMNLRLLPAVVDLERGRAEPGGMWLTGPKSSTPSMSARDRIGRQVATTFEGQVGGARVADPWRLLAPHQLWLAYERTPDVRSCVDGIARRVATHPWIIEPDVPLTDEDYPELLDASRAGERFLRSPNADGETWQEVATKLVTDLLIYEQGALENVFDKTQDLTPTDDDKWMRGAKLRVPAAGAKLEELVTLNGASVMPLIDEYGRLRGYRQDTFGMLGPYGGLAGVRGDVPLTTVLTRDQVVFFRLFPNTLNRPTPIIETIVHEVMTVLRAAEHALLAIDADEIPPGLLVLTGLAGKAADDAKRDAQRMRGKDHKIRVVTTPDPKGHGGHWIEMRHTMKDLALIDVVRETRRAIWRGFGVMPVEQGDTQDMPRATAAVQLDVSSSHLIEPLLESIEAKINTRILPLVVGADHASRMRFRFDREVKLSPAEQKEKADSLVALVREGILTRNEARAQVDMEPQAGGDVLTVSTSLGLERVANLGAPDDDPETTPDSTTPDGAPKAGTGGDGAAGAGDGEDASDAGPGESGGTAEGAAEDPASTAAGKTRRSGITVSGFTPHVRAANDLPSEWPSAERFVGYRTLDLRALGDAVGEYERAVTPLYAEAQAEVLASIVAVYADRDMTAEDAMRALNGFDAALRKLEDRWSITTAPLYRAAAKNGRDKAVDFTGAQVVGDWQDRAGAYHQRAMGYLTQIGGMLAELRQQLVGIVASVQGEPSTARAKKGIIERLAPGIALEEVTAAAIAAFQSESHRIANWAGRLVELANSTLTSGMTESGEQWMVEWVAVGDDRMCPTCAREGARGFIPIESLTVQPGGNTECRARDRCVLVMWTRDEVTSGKAKRIGPLEG